MIIVAVDDTDSRTDGMCTTYVATRLAERLASDANGRVLRQLLVRLNPAVKHKTRGNAAVALHVAGIDASDAFEMACDLVADLAVASDPRTSPGVVVADLGDWGDWGDGDCADGDCADVNDGSADTLFDPSASPIPAAIGNVARRAVRERLSVAEAVALADEYGILHSGVTDCMRGAGANGPFPPTDGEIGRGRIGALAAVGAPIAFDDWTHEHISYREFDRCGTPRRVDAESVFAAADDGYPTVWDTVDRGTGEVVCVPNAPGPILHGIRGDDPSACRAVAAAIESEPIDRATTFLTNQGTDVHLGPGQIGNLRDGAGYQVNGVVTSEPATRQGGHVHVAIAAMDNETDPDVEHQPALDPPLDPESTLHCVAFAPTGRFRDRIRALRPGDRVTVCGEHEVRELGSEPAQSTLKLEKCAVHDLVRIERVTPTCPVCGRRMSSAGRDQGYRCRDCDTAAPDRVEQPLERNLDVGWYEVPPSARRHVAKPLVRGGFDGPVHPER